MPTLTITSPTCVELLTVAYLVTAPYSRERLQQALERAKAHPTWETIQFMDDFTQQFAMVHAINQVHVFHGNDLPQVTYECTVTGEAHLNRLLHVRFHAIQGLEKSLDIGCELHIWNQGNSVLRMTWKAFRAGMSDAAALDTFLKSCEGDERISFDEIPLLRAA
ncbi:MAG: hypothetical protein GC129_00285 [Proteobacteria bacterium]|nr:hypothetical protein [Pseudomonadota bacterium]